ncbi:MAG: iron-containing alcohol dehydrogenase [Meiothermus sp.]|nr:iron-containing alcohol dehydrogenase [Meiothermus sp.]
MAAYELGKVPRILVGGEAVDGLAGLVRGLGGKSVAFVVDGVVAKGGYLERLQSTLDGIRWANYLVPPGEPTVGVVNEAAAVARQLRHPVVVGVGGGSALDTAKQVAGVIAADHPIEHYLLYANPWAGRRPIIAIPTTSGTGSEVTRTCIVSDADGRKMWTWGDELLPDVVILDAAVTATMPAWVTASTGLDALVHALEAATGQRRNPISAGMALQAIRLVIEHLPTAVKRPGDLEARQGMQEAALLAGMAIDNCGTGIAHNIGHALGTLYHIPHGVAVTVALEAALPWNLKGNEGVYAQAAACFGVEPKKLPQAFKRLLKASGFAEAVRGVRTGRMGERAVAQTMQAPENQPMWKNNVRLADKDERLELARRTLEVWQDYRR